MNRITILPFRRENPLLSMKLNFNKGICLILLSALMFACSHKPDQIVLQGSVENGANQKVILEAAGITSHFAIDSAICLANGEFTLKGKMTSPGFYTLRLSGQKEYITLAMHPGEKIKLFLPASEYWKNYTVDGSEDSKRVRDLNLANYELMDKIKAFGKIFHDSINSPNLPKIKAGLDSSYHALIAVQKSWVRDFAKQNTHYLASLMALFQRMPSGNPAESEPLLNAEEDYALFRTIDSTLNTLYPTAEPVKAVHAEVLVMEEDRRQKERIGKISAIGATPPDIRLPSLKGDSLSLYSLRGKYVLLVFWGSFDPNSRLENKNLYSLYYNYHWKGLEIFQIGIERSKEAWAQAVSADKMSWPQVYDLRFWSSPLVPVFQLEKLPVIYLLDKEGKIISKNLQGEELLVKIQNLFRSQAPMKRKSILPPTDSGKNLTPVNP